MRKTKGTGQWSGKNVPGMYQDGGDISMKNMLKNKPGDISMKGKGPKLVKPNPTATFNKKAVKTALKKVGKKRAVNLIPLLGQALLVKQIGKEIFTGGKGIKKNIKNIKDFSKTGDWGHILEGKSSKKTTPKKTVKKTKKKKETYLDKRNRPDITPQSQRVKSNSNKVDKDGKKIKN